MDLKIEGKKALVTGASMGIGRGIALALGAEGVQLALVARRGNLLEEVAAEITAKGGPQPVLIVQDFLADDAPQNIAETALAKLGGIDIIINNAGGSRSFKVDASEDLWTEAMTLNFTRQRQITHRLLDQMIARKWGRIVNITGKSEPEGLNGAFCAKAAMHAWSKGLSREIGKHGITVNCIPPGRIMSEQIRRNYTPEYRQWQSEHEIPVGRYGEPEEIANLVCFLVSPLGELHYRDSHPRRWRVAAIPILSTDRYRLRHACNLPNTSASSSRCSSLAPSAVSTIMVAMPAAAAVAPASSMCTMAMAASLVDEPYRKITAETVVSALTKI